MTENTAEKKVLAEAAEIFPGEDTADLKRLFSGSLPAAETADKDEEVPALNIAEINKDLGCLSEALSRMSLDELLDFKSELKSRVPAEEQPREEAGAGEGGTRPAALSETAAPEVFPVKANLRPSADGSFLERDLKNAAMLSASVRSAVLEASENLEAPKTETEKAAGSAEPEPGTPEALQKRISEYESGKKSLDSSGLQALGFIFSFGFTVAAVVFAFWWMAEYAIAHTGWDWLMAPFILVGAIFGLFMGFYMMAPYLRNLDRKKGSGQDKKT